MDNSTRYVMQGFILSFESKQTCVSHSWGPLWTRHSKSVKVWTDLVYVQANLCLLDTYIAQDIEEEEEGLR